jgi:hypothetical protein
MPACITCITEGVLGVGNPKDQLSAGVKQSCKPALLAGEGNPQSCSRLQAVSGPSAGVLEASSPLPLADSASLASNCDKRGTAQQVLTPHPRHSCSSLQLRTAKKTAATSANASRRAMNNMFQPTQYTTAGPSASEMPFVRHWKERSAQPWDEKFTKTKKQRVGGATKTLGPAVSKGPARG